MDNTINCPISPDKVDENSVRIASFLTLIILTTGILLNSSILLLILALDFSLRSLTKGKYSIVRFASKRISNYLNITKKPIDAAPKKFAAGLGMIFSFLIAVFLLAGNLTMAWLLGVVLGICAILEGALAFCVGCYIYSYIILPFLKPHQLKVELKK